jgi:hypothetical protein
MSKRCIWRGLALGLALVLARPHTASARGIVLITHGETIKHVGDIPKATKEAYCDYLRKVHACHLDPAVGYTYRYWGIFWLDFWTWDGRYCTYNDRTIIEEFPKGVTAKLLGVPEHELGIPFFYRFPPGLVIIAGFILLGVLSVVFRKSPVQKAKVLIEDVRYQRALEIIAEELRKEEEAAKAHAAAGTQTAAPEVPSLTPFDAAIEYLVSEGIPRGEAQANLATILSTQTGTSADSA